GRQGAACCHACAQSPCARRRSGGRLHSSLPRQPVFQVSPGSVLWGRFAVFIESSMSRIDGGDFGWAADEARRLADQAQLDQQRQADLERARVLAATMPAALDPGNTRGPEDLGRILAEVQRMTAEARLGFGSDVARLSAAAPPPRDPGALTAALIDEACPRGSGRRRRLGETLVASFGANPTGVPPRVLEAAVTQALASLTAP